MDPQARISLKELYLALVDERPGLTYDQLYARMAYLRKKGALPGRVNTSALTLEQAEAIARVQGRRKQPVRKATVTVLRQQLKRDGIL